MVLSYVAKTKGALLKLSAVLNMSMFSHRQNVRFIPKL